MPDAQYIHGTAEAEQRRLAALNRLVNPPFLEFLQLDGADSILEVGSGLGLLACEVARRAPQARVVGVEYSPEQLAKAIDRPANLQLVQGDAHHLQFADASFDLVYCRFVLEHVADPDRVVREMHRVVRPGGRVNLMENDCAIQVYDPPVPMFDKVWARMTDLQRQLGGDALIGRRLFRLMKHAGFRGIRISMAPESYCADEPGLKTWITNEQAILVGCADALIQRGLATQEEVDTAIDELQTLSARPDATAWFYWNRAVGVK